MNFPGFSTPMGLVSQILVSRGRAVGLRSRLETATVRNSLDNLRWSYGFDRCAG